MADDIANNCMVTVAVVLMVVVVVVAIVRQTLALQRNVLVHSCQHRKGKKTFHLNDCPKSTINY